MYFVLFYPLFCFMHIALVFYCFLLCIHAFTLCMHLYYFLSVIFTRPQCMVARPHCYFCFFCSQQFIQSKKRQILSDPPSVLASCSDTFLLSLLPPLSASLRCSLHVSQRLSNSLPSSFPQTAGRNSAHPVLQRKSASKVPSGNSAPTSAATAR